MDVNVYAINKVFVDNITLRIPFFQRGYVWQESNWEKFFDDIADIARTIKAGERPETYFLGSIITKSDDDDELIIDVIDGQQRLTTIVLFMKALYLAMGRAEKFVTGFMQDTDEVGEMKPILQPNRNDRAVYNRIINLETLQQDPIVEGSLLADAFSYFAKRLKAAEAGVDDIPITPTQINNAIARYVRLVQIEVQQGENAQKIFETINCAGVKLTTGEMLKNFLYDEAHVVEYERTWKTVFEADKRAVKYWEGDILNGRMQGSQIENFFYRYMLVKMQEPEVKDKLSQNEKKSFRQYGGQFEKFRNLITRCNIDKNTAADEIVNYARLYMDTFKDDTLEEVTVSIPGLERLVSLMFIQGSWTTTPYILYILRNVTDKNEQNRIFNYMEVYLMRRIICKSKNNNYSDMFSENLIGSGIKTFAEFKAYVNDENERGALLMPSNEDVKKAVKENNNKTSALAILYMLESKLNPNFASSAHNNSYVAFTKEQIMPEKDNGSWPSALGYSAEQRSCLVNTLGNFAIMREKLKPKASKSAWDYKREAMKIGLEDLEFYDIATRGLANWDEKVIEKRNSHLADKILDAWPC